MIVASGLSLKFQVAGYHKLLLIKPWALQLCRGFKEAYKQRRLYPRGVITGTEKHFETSCSSAYQNMFCIYWFLIKLQNITINRNRRGFCSYRGAYNVCLGVYNNGCMLLFTSSLADNWQWGGRAFKWQFMV